MCLVCVCVCVGGGGGKVAGEEEWGRCGGAEGMWSGDQYLIESLWVGMVLGSSLGFGPRVASPGPKR